MSLLARRLGETSTSTLARRPAPVPARPAHRSGVVDSGGADVVSPEFLDEMVAKGAGKTVVDLFKLHLEQGGGPDRQDFLDVLSGLVHRVRDDLAEVVIAGDVGALPPRPVAGGPRGHRPVAEWVDPTSAGTMPLDEVFGVSLDDLLGS